MSAATTHAFKIGSDHVNYSQCCNKCASHSCHICVEGRFDVSALEFLLEKENVVRIKRAVSCEGIIMDRADRNVEVTSLIVCRFGRDIRAMGFNDVCFERVGISSGGVRNLGSIHVEYNERVGRVIFERAPSGR